MPLTFNSNERSTNMHDGFDPDNLTLTAKAQDELDVSIGNRLPGESDFNVHIANIWLHLGPGRNYYVLQLECQRLLAENALDRIPTPEEIRQWRTKFSWDTRAAKYDRNLESYHEYQAYSTFTHPLAQTWGRVQKLINLAQTLESLMAEHELTEISQRVSKAGTVVMSEKLNTDLISAYRSILHDISSELGQRNANSAPVDPNTLLSRNSKKLDVESLSDVKLTELSKLLNEMMVGEDE